VIVDEEEVAGQANDENVQAQWYGCLVDTDGYSNTSESYFPYIPYESLSGVKEL